jgi:hypothetical protein
MSKSASTSICNTFIRLAMDTWDTISESRIVNHQLKEETLTDINMLALKRRHGATVRTRVFTKTQEGRNGADWEWWFKGRTGNWIGFRVQAKIINLHTDSFDHLHYKGKGKPYQCDLLIQNALSGATPRIPLYCLFIETPTMGYLNAWTCMTYPYVRELYGCSLISATAVRKLRTGKKRHLTDLQPYLRPWHCLVCCRGYGHSDFITNIIEYSKANYQFGTEDMTGLDVVLPESFVTSEPPTYVLSVFENERTDNIEPPDPEIDGLLIISEDENSHEW